MNSAALTNQIFSQIDCFALSSLVLKKKAPLKEITTVSVWPRKFFITSSLCQISRSDDRTVQLLTRLLRALNERMIATVLELRWNFRSKSWSSESRSQFVGLLYLNCRFQKHKCWKENRKQHWKFTLLSPSNAWLISNKSKILIGRESCLFSLFFPP